MGVATAISVGGPGALFWMLLSASVGMATQFTEGFLAIRYSEDSKIIGPFSYMERGLRNKFLGKLYALITVISGLLGVGTIIQINSITYAVDQLIPRQPILQNCSIPMLASTGIVCFFAFLVILGGGDRISKVCQYLVPFMSAIFLFCSLFLLLRNIQKLPHALVLVVKGAFDPKAVMGGTVGIGLQQVMRMGIGRGVLTNEAGMGTTAIAAGTSGEKDPYKQGLVSMSATFIDTIVICTLSGLSLILTDVWQSPYTGGQLTTYAWQTGLPGNGHLWVLLLNLCLIFFAFATILGWGFYAEQCLCYLTKGRGLRLYRTAYIATLFVGPFLTVSTAFDLADILNGLMSVPNLLSILLLQEEVVKEVRKRD